MIASHARLAPAIADYGIIGDGRATALVSRDGAIDWLCLPYFSSPSVFARILDAAGGGTCVITPGARYKATRRYRPGTAVLETLFETDTGKARVTDFFPVEDAANALLPGREIIRIVEGLEGAVALDVTVDPRPDYGRRAVKPRYRRNLGWSYSWDNNFLAVGSDMALDCVGTGLVGRHEVQAGRRATLDLAYSQDDVGVWPALGEETARRLHLTAAWWADWIKVSAYRGPYRDLVERSAITLKLLTYSLSGAIVAAASASLPENPGGARNWDYRFCWLRDSALAVQAMIGLGYMAEARRYLSWLLHATRLTWPHLQVVYDVYGRTKLHESELGHLAGHGNAKPVRIGNGACGQYQLDVYGEVVFAGEAFAAAGGSLEPVEVRLLRGLAKTVAREWKCPDHGIWEIRGERRHYTFSKMMCWLALDRLLKLESGGVVQLGPLGDRLRGERHDIAAAIETHAYNRETASYAGVLEGHEPDASLLLMGCRGFPAASDPCLERTHAQIWKTLGCGPVAYRYPGGSDGIEESEGAFLVLSFWSVENLATRGDIAAARRLFEEAVRYGNDLGLFAEEADPRTGAALGNFPQAFSHTGLINAALAIAKAERTAAPC